MMKHLKTLGRAAFWTLQALAIAIAVYVLSNTFLLLSAFDARSAEVGNIEIELDEADREADCVVEQVITENGSRFCMVCYLDGTRFVPFCY